ncbi:MAG: 30S ribosomal protein S20 [Verrucomicrobiae bacterium]|nr:30S ribosomal protein S20 [Verrucomicrobiae bacterium]MCX7722672.1 30S ribosomal protein S20 [Verrucomicrobiae bacterium]MDW7979266.1 30S ribosomal protein S20 [Verrucomicrobiales bacterium]
MARTRSAQRRARKSERRRLRNRAVKMRVRRLEKQFLAQVTANKKQEASDLFRKVCSALDKAAESGVLHKKTVARKKSRLAARLNALK